MVPNFGLTDAPVLIAGASRGLGRALAVRLAREGCRLALCARGRGPLDEFAQHLRETYGVVVYAQAADVTEHAAVVDFVGNAARALGGLAGVVCNVGGGRGGSTLADTSSDDWAYTLDVNLVSSMAVLREAVPHLAECGGSAVLVSSISGWKPAPGLAYGVAKAGLIHAAAVLGRELGGMGVRVNVAAPGSMLVPGRRWDRLRTEDPASFERLRREFPAGRLLDPDEVAAVIAFLLSPSAAAVNGALIPIDAGQNAPGPDGY